MSSTQRKSYKPQDAAEIIHGSYKKIHKLWEDYCQHGRIISPIKRGRKKLNAQLCYEGSALSIEHIVKLQDYVLELNESEKGVTLKKLRKKLLAEFQIEVRNHTIRKILLSLGYQWGRAKKVGKLKTCSSRSRRTREYLIAYAEAFQLERNGMHIAVYMDESYCHQRHASGPSNPKLRENRRR